MARKYAQVWLSRYSWPEGCVHDHGGEFAGPEFQFLLQKYRIKDTPTSSKNPHANATCECLHQTVGNVLEALLHGEPPQPCHQSKILHRQSIINRHTSHVLKHPYYLRK